MAQVRIGFGELIAVARVRTGVLLRCGCVKLIKRVALFAHVNGIAENPRALAAGYLAG